MVCEEEDNKDNEDFEDQTGDKREMMLTRQC
jgi:hypothetical protein